MEINLYLTKPCYNEQILTVPWPFVISRFLYNEKIEVVNKDSTVPYFSNPLPWALDILITDSFSSLNNKTDKEMIQLEWFLFCHNQTHTLLTKALMKAGSLKYQNGNSGKNITLKIIDFTFLETSE